MVPRTQVRKGERYEYYECYGHHRDPSTCSVSLIRREAIDTPIYRYFERVGLDVEATRARLVETQQGHLAEVQATRDQADQDAQKARENLERIRRDYKTGKLDADDWREFRDELTEQVEAADAQLARLDSQLNEVQQSDRLLDLETEVVEKLAAIRAAVAGEVASADGVDAARAAIQRLFEGFALQEPRAGLSVPAELAWGGGGYVLEPRLRDGATALRREPLYTAADNSVVGVVM
jgi:hypothetical protein